jgi:hypothetical protein
LEHAQTCLGTWVCLTQHPSDTLQPFQELNCHSLYDRKFWNSTLNMVIMGRLRGGGRLWRVTSFFYC